jgi:L-cysteine desulfidase
VVTGAFLGDPSKELEVLENIDKTKLEECDGLISKGIVEITLKKDHPDLYIEICMKKNNKSSRVIIEDSHTNIILKERNGQIIQNATVLTEKHEENIDLSFEKIYDFADNGDYSQVKSILDLEIKYNYEIAKDGIENNWGSNIGSMILETSNNPYDKYVAYAAAGSDARMSGSEKPVVINSGSGNQGLTVSVPIILYAEDNNIEKDKLYRALILSNLLSLYIKEGIGKLSAYCGAISAASAAVAGIAYLKGENKELIKDVLSNSLATNSGVLCDGAKPSCAAKIASGLKIGFLSYKQAKYKNSFESGDGIVKENIDQTIKSIGCIAKEGMKETDVVILREMINVE